MSSLTAVAIRHVAFEDLGSFRAPMERAGYKIDYCDPGVDELGALEPVVTDLVVILGGPIGAYDEVKYPFLNDELRILKDRLAAGRPTLGICLGAQLMARAFGARVYAGSAKEIGWAPVELTNAGRSGPLRHLGNAAVLHWHGDTFDLPPDCERLASTGIYHNQAFASGPNILGLQFHPEAVKSGFERWLIGHACELVQADILPQTLRLQWKMHAPDLERRAEQMITEWLATLRR